jgi:diacylglycerol kinase (ATP)
MEGWPEGPGWLRGNARHPFKPRHYWKILRIVPHEVKCRFRFFENLSMAFRPPKGRTGIARLVAALGYSFDGLLAAFRGEAAFRQLVALHVVLIPLAFFCPVSRGERALMIAVCLLSFIVELFNSAIEAVIDRISEEHHPLSKNAKDMGSAAQFIALILIAVVWGVILLGPAKI